MNLLRFSIWAFVLLFLVTGCEEATLVGSDILAGEQLELGFNSETKLTASTVTSELLDTRNNFTYMVGQLDDPIFGKTNAELYMTIIRDITLPDLTDATVDSLVLIMEHDTSGIYGDTLAMHQLQVFRMRESILDFDTIYNNQSFMTDMTPIGETMIGVNPFDSLTIKDPATGEDERIPAQIRIPLDVAFGEEIVAALPDIETDTGFVSVFNGLKVTSIPDRSSLLGINPQGTSGLAKMTMYYHKGEDTTTVNFRIVTNTSAFIEHDQSGYPIDEFIGDPLKGDSLLFMQGMAGPEVELDLDDVRNLGDIFINYAILELTIAELPMDNEGLYRTVSNTITTEKQEGETLLTEDVLSVLNTSNFTNVFGGNIQSEEVDGVTVRKVRLNVTRQVKKIIEDPSYDSKINVSPLFKIERPQRMVFYGPGHSMYPAKLNITFTRN